MSVHLIFYSKPGCHLCEGLHEKLEQIQSLDLDIDVRDITTRDDWFQAYQYEIPVLVLVQGEEQGERGEESGVKVIDSTSAAGVNNFRRSQDSREAGEAEDTIQNSNLYPLSFSLQPSAFIPLPRPSPRATVQQLEQMLRKYL